MIRSILIFSYILIVLLISGLARAQASQPVQKPTWSQDVLGLNFGDLKTFRA